MPECPTFLDLPARPAKPRWSGITHVLDKGLTPEATQAFLGQAAHLIDIVKVGWGIGYVDPSLPVRVRMCAEHDSPVCLGGTLLEVAAMQDRVASCATGRWPWASAMSRSPTGCGPWPQSASARWCGSWPPISSCSPRPAPRRETTRRPPRAGPTRWPVTWTPAPSWVVAEGRESGTVGLYDSDHVVREDLVKVILDRVPQDRVIFEAPTKAQQAWFVRQLGAHVNIGNVEPGQRPGPGNAAAGIARGYGHPAGALT